MIGVVAMCLTATAGPWVHGPGEAYVKAETSVFAGLAGQAPEGEGMTTGQARTSLYAEIGLPAGFMVTGAAPYVIGWNEHPDARFVTASGGDASLSVTHGLVRERPIAAEVRVNGPLYRDRTASRTERFGALATDFPVAGDGSVSVDGLLHAGGGLKIAGQPGWVQASAGPRVRLAGRPAAVVFDGAVGWSPERGWLGVGVGGVENLADDGVSRDGTALRAFGALRTGQGWAVEASGGWMPMTRNMSPGVSGGLGLSWDR